MALEKTNNSTKIYPMPNSWRTKARGRLIKHVPINLYLDDTSGNLSKKFTKHIFYYFTLAGLPPNISNMKYNCHFLCTSNTAGILELGEQGVYQLKPTLPCTPKSPTPGPGKALNACRMCNLKGNSLQERKTPDYVFWPLGLNSDGEEAEWKAELYKLEADNATKHRLFNPLLRLKGKVLEISFHKKFTLDFDILACHGSVSFDGCKDTPVEILHVFLLGVVKYMVRDFLKSLTVRKLLELLQWRESVNINALNIPWMKPAYKIKHYKSLVGKDFNIILQVAPFVFFKFMSLDQQNHWMALCMLSTYVFTTKIDNMTTSLSNICKYIRIFLHHTIKMSARWANKPKFHMLLHLPESIE
ncbi:hypothetical protein VP01_4946g3 [Puccinia sorghi]|uniref:Uncharacterized protein n=1 Tax=Puccinia sorghi TaxID=27349 RepID=A0A0L6UM00_9BASI|nr:hypothetical protein VP01_4946g3 [Puccinia sorghi]